MFRLLVFFCKGESSPDAEAAVGGHLRLSQIAGFQKAGIAIFAPLSSGFRLFLVMEADTSEIKVFISHRESKCVECGNDLGKHAWICLKGDREAGEETGALCLACADLDHLVFLPTGDAALTRRSKKHSALWAVVLKWSRARKRYERQGLLVEESALEKAEEECLEDQDARERRRDREAERRSEVDAEFVRKFAGRIRELFPKTPRGREQKIAEHACRKYSGRVGRSAAAKELEPEAIRLAVVAHIRHTETDYDLLLAKGSGRGEARQIVQGEIEEILQTWEG